MKKIFLTLLAVSMLGTTAFAERIESTSEATATEKKEKKQKKNVTYNEKGEIIKTGINLGPLPVVAFDADRGFQFGALLNIYDFGNGANYPNPNSQWYIEASAYAKDSRIGSYKFVLNYDNKTLIPGVRMSICTGYFKDAALDFYGFNGYQSIYDMGFIRDNLVWDDNKAGQKLENKYIKSGEKLKKIPKGFYRYGRDVVRLRADFTGEILKNFYWEAGWNFSWTKTQAFSPKGYTVFPGINPASDYKGTSLYQLYKDWGIISADEADGGFSSGVRLGLMYDSRNVENNPTKGIWAEGHLMLNPWWLGTTRGHDYYKYCLTMRHYVPIIPETLTFAYRISYEGTIGKNAPWYIAPYYTSMGIKPDYDGFGGYRTVRGLMLNRVQGLDVGFYNIEFRYKFVEFKLWKQNIAFALSAFTDGAHVFRGYDMAFTEKSQLALLAADPVTGAAKAALYKDFVRTGKDGKFVDGLHGSAGLGLRFIMNQNFIVAFEGAQCFNKQDGGFAFYLNTGFLF